MKMYKAIPSFFAKTRKVSIILDYFSEGGINSEIRFMGSYIATASKWCTATHDPTNSLLNMLLQNIGIPSGFICY